MINNKDIFIENIQNIDFCYKDNFRFQFHLERKILEYSEKIDLNHTENINFNEIDIEKVNILPNRHYLGISKERISLPPDIMGYLYTSSKFARYGIEFLKSSNIINPNFGFEKPEPIIFEISSKIEVTGLNSFESYSYCLFFNIGKSKDYIPKSQYNRFPFKN